jgi:hypothetical protein
VIAPETLRLAEGYVAVKPLGPVKVKGVSEPVDVYEVISAGTVRTRLQRSAARGFTPFVGRDAEMEQLRGAFERAGGGHGQVVAVVGEPGVGKSRLFYEFVRSHRTHDWLVVESGSVSYGTATLYLPVIDLLKAYFQIDARDDGRTIREKVTGKLLTLDETLRPLLPPLLALLDVPVEDRDWQALDPPQRRRHTHEAIKRLLLRESQRQPLCRRAARDASARHALSSRSRQAPSRNRPAGVGPESPRHRRDHVPGHGHAVLAGEGDGRDGRRLEVTA